MAAPERNLHVAESVPRTGWVPFKMFCPPDLRDRIMREAAMSGLTGAAYVRSLVVAHLRAQDST